MTSLARRALDHALRLPSTLTRARRWPLMLGLVVAIGGTALLPTTPARADASQEWAARMQVVLTGVRVIDDRDPGKGEMKYDALFCATTNGEGCQAKGALVSGVGTFSAGSGDYLGLGRTVPGGEDTLAEGISLEAGIPLYAGQRYLFSMHVEEQDDLSGNEQMGVVLAQIDESNGWGVGSFHVPSVKSNGKQGDYELTYEIRPAPLADLHPGAIKVEDLPGGAKKRVCTPIRNGDGAAAGNFDVALHVDGAVPQGGRTTVNGLGPGGSTDACVEVQLSAPGEHELKVVVDGQRQVFEGNETNNIVKQSFTVTAPAPTPTPAPAKVDLVLSEIRVNGQVPDGKKDCKDGKNDISVVVKNTGADAAGPFTVRLAVDEAKLSDPEQTVSGLKAGQKQEIRFEDVRLTKGEHALIVIADSGKTVAESNEQNNELTVTARCKGDDH